MLCLCDDAAMIGSSGNDREDKSAEPDEPRPKKRKTKCVFLNLNFPKCYVVL